mmetsp:Transcript_59050/g.191231  ORF Transcript_59050/g.191231 Transcript_59050/m.191231 type:complete len:213 (+) Transcript_59050:185-823(+)
MPTCPHFHHHLFQSADCCIVRDGGLLSRCAPGVRCRPRRLLLLTSIGCCIVLENVCLHQCVPMTPCQHLHHHLFLSADFHRRLSIIAECCVVRDDIYIHQYPPILTSCRHRRLHQVSADCCIVRDSMPLQLFHQLPQSADCCKSQPSRLSRRKQPSRLRRATPRRRLPCKLLRLACIDCCTERDGIHLLHHRLQCPTSADCCVGCDHVRQTG